MRWVRTSKSGRPSEVRPVADGTARSSRHNACMNCHTVGGNRGQWAFGPDLTHLMSRDTIASGAASNTRENLRPWSKIRTHLSPDALMPAMQLNDHRSDRVTSLT